jgi:hypothetical protein
VPRLTDSRRVELFNAAEMANGKSATSPRGGDYSTQVPVFPPEAVLNNGWRMQSAKVKVEMPSGLRLPPAVPHRRRGKDESSGSNSTRP